MPKEPRIKKELSLIESVIEHSKEILDINNTVLLAKALIFTIAKGKYKPLDSQNLNLKSLIKEFETRREELDIRMANMLKGAYSHLYNITFNKFHLSSAQMAAGYAMFSVTKKGESQWVILFLTNCQPDFLEHINAGEIRDYDEQLEKDYLDHCKSAWKPGTLNDLYMEHLKQMMTS